MEKHCNINIISTGIYIPTKKMENEYYIEHFSKMGIKVEGLLDHMDKKTRYYAENGETSLSMGHEAALMALENSNVTRNDIDMIIFVSAQPEFLNPTTAMELRDLLKANNAHTVFDLNDTCLGGVTAINVACNYAMTSDDISTILIVAGQNISSVVDTEDTVAYSLMGDCASAVIVKKEYEATKRGFINNATHCRCAYVGHIKFPNCGLTKALSNTDTHIPKKDRNFTWDSFDISWMGKDFSHIIEKVLKKSNLKPADLDMCFMSQFSKKSIEKGLELQGIPLEKNYYIGHLYGYTGPTSPILALHCGMQEGLVKKGDIVLMGSVGSGIDYSMSLFKF